MCTISDRWFLGVWLGFGVEEFGLPSQFQVTVTDLNTDEVIVDEAWMVEPEDFETVRPTGCVNETNIQCEHFNATWDLPAE